MFGPILAGTGLDVSHSEVFAGHRSFPSLKKCPNAAPLGRKQGCSPSELTLIWPDVVMVLSPLWLP